RVALRLLENGQAVSGSGLPQRALQPGAFRRSGRRRDDAARACGDRRGAAASTRADGRTGGAILLTARNAALPDAAARSTAGRVLQSMDAERSGAESYR